MSNFLWNLPLARRVSLLTTVAVALTVIIFSVVGYSLLTVALHRTSQATALTIANELAGPAARELATTGVLSAQLEQPAGVVVEAVDVEGRVLQTPGQQQTLVLKDVDRAAAGPDGKTSKRLGVLDDGQAFAIVAVPLPGTGYALVVGRPLAAIDAILQLERLILLATCAAGIGAAALAGYLVGRSAVRPMRQLTEAVEHVTATQDLHSVSVRHAQGGVATLTAAFNTMLASITTARSRQSRLVADAGHELRTPLTSLRLNVDLLVTDLLRDKLPLEQRTAVLSDLQGQLSELNELIGDLVHVAREDSALAIVPLDVRAVVEESLERVGRRSQGATFDVEMDPLFVVANPETMVRAVTNLLDNAVKWSPPGGVIRVRLEGNRLRIADAGPGIPEVDLPYVFDRFFRGESARNTKGTGLGLAIVAKAVSEMGGTVTAGRSAAGGAEFTLQLPGVTTREAVASVLVPSS